MLEWLRYCGIQERYDFLSVHGLFLVSWSIWNLLDFAAVSLVNSLLISDLQVFLQHLLCHPPGRRGHQFSGWPVQGYSTVKCGRLLCRFGRKLIWRHFTAVFSDSVDVTNVCRERQQVSTSVIPLPDFFLGGNEFIGDSTNQNWDQDPVASEPAECHDRPEQSVW